MLPGNCVQTASLCRSLPDFHLRQDRRACQQRQTAVTPWASLLRVVSLSLPFHSVFFPFPPSSLSVSICLCWQAVLHIIHQDDLVVVEEGAPQIHLQTPSCPPLHFLAYCFQLQTPVRVFTRAGEMCHYQVSQEPPQGAFSSQHAFPLAGYSFRRGRQYRKESGLIGMPPPTVPACVFLSAALLWAHGNVGSDTQLQQILTRGGPRKWDFLFFFSDVSDAWTFCLTQFCKW